MNAPDIHTLLAPYALGAVDPDERARFEAHLDHCAECRDELTGFLETSTRLAEANEFAPPAELRTRVLATATATTQERPIVVALHHRGRLRRALPRLAVAAAALVAIAGVTGYVVEHQRVTELRAEQDRATSIMTADDSSMSYAELENGASVRMISSTSEDGAVVIAKGFLDDAETSYQVWTIADGKPTSRGVFESGGMMTMDGIGAAEIVAITIEPQGGSEVPSGAPIAAMDV